MGSLFLSSCKAGEEAPTEIRLGCPVSLTGMYSGFGQGGVFGAKAAVEDINKQGGIFIKEAGKKLPVKLVVVDIASDSVKAGTLQEALILQDKVDGLVSPVEVPDLMAIRSKVGEKYGVPHVGSIGPMENWLGMWSPGELPKYTWLTAFSLGTPAPEGDFRYGKAGYLIGDTWKAGLDMVKDQTNGKVGIYGSDDPDGKGWYAALGPAVKAWGYDPVGWDQNKGMFPYGTIDFSAMIKFWRDEEVDILFGNCSGPDFGTMWRQINTTDWKPKIVIATKASLFWEDVSSWGGDLPQGICCELWWHPGIADSPGIGSTTPQSLADSWTEETGKGLNRAIGYGYLPTQIMLNAIERAGTLDKEEINKALAQTDMQSIWSRVVFDENHISRVPVCMGQWSKTDKSYIWDVNVIYSDLPSIPVEAPLIFPIP